MKKKIISVFTALTLMVLSCIGGLTFTDIVPKEDYHDWYTYYILDADKGESVKKIFTDNGATITSTVTPEDSFPTGTSSAVYAGTFDSNK